MIRINVLLFSTIRAIVGKKTLVIDLPQDSTVWDLKLEIARQFPHSDQAVRTMLTSVNRIFSSDEETLVDQAEVAFFPFVSGG